VPSSGKGGKGGIAIHLTNSRFPINWVSKNKPQNLTKQGLHLKEGVDSSTILTKKGKKARGLWLKGKGMVRGRGEEGEN